MIEPSQEDIGRKVIYKPHHATDLSCPPCEEGIITSFNESVVFVRYRGTTSAATNRDQLHWVSP